MPPFHIVVTSSARRSLKGVPRRVLTRLDEAILALADDPFPSGCRKLEGMKGLWRIRVGAYRIVYRVTPSEFLVEIAVVGHRSSVYRHL